MIWTLLTPLIWTFFALLIVSIFAIMRLHRIEQYLKTLQKETGIEDAPSPSLQTRIRKWLFPI